MTARLTLVAHAETRAARQGVFGRDDRLTERGQAAARAMRKAVPRTDSVICSPAPAARETAAALGLAPLTEPALRGLDLGTWTGRSLPDIAGADPDAAVAWIGDPTYAGHGGETIQSVIARTRAWLDARRSQGAASVAITHAPVLRAAVVVILEAAETSFWRVDVGPLTTLTLTSDSRKWTLSGLVAAP